MPALKEAKVTNHLLHRVQDEIRQGGAIDYLVFADDNPQLLRRLGDAMRAVQKQIVVVSQERWQAAGEEISEVAEWAVGEAGADWVVLVGSSAFRGAGEVITDPGDAASVIKAANQRTLQAEQRFGDRVADFLSTPSLASRLQEGRLKFHCLYYRCESDTFASFNPVDGTFQALVH